MDSSIGQSSPEAMVWYFWQPATMPVCVGAAGVAVLNVEVVMVLVVAELAGPTPMHTARILLQPRFA